MSYPFLTNSNNTLVNYGQISFGLRFGVAYKPQNTQFFPMLTFAFGRTRLPLKQFNKNVAALNFDYLNVMINENYIVHFPTSELFIYGGIGVSYLINKGLTIAGAGGGTSAGLGGANLLNARRTAGGQGRFCRDLPLLGQQPGVLDRPCDAQRPGAVRDASRAVGGRDGRVD